MANEEGLPFDQQANEAIRGLSRRESLMRIVGDRQFSEAQIQAMMERKNRYYQELLSEIGPEYLLSGAGELLDELRKAGIKIAIGSGSKNARTVIERLGIAERLDAISDGDSVQRSKPEPDLFLHAASQLGLEAAQCVVVEDAAAGIEAALAASMLTVELVHLSELVQPTLSCLA